jgi:hypothetical protein
MAELRLGGDDDWRRLRPVRIAQLSGRSVLRNNYECRHKIKELSDASMTSQQVGGIGAIIVSDAAYLSVRATARKDRRSCVN